MQASERPSARDPGPRGVTFGSRRSARLLSIALHLVIVYVVGRVSWTIPEMQAGMPINVVWLRDWLPPEEERAAVPPQEEPEDLDPQAPVDESPAPPPEADVVSEGPRAEPTPEEPLSTEREPESVPPRIEPLPVEEAPASLSEAADEESLPSAVDWVEARQRAIERRREEQEREEGYLTFSWDDRVSNATPFRESRWR